MHDFSFVSCIVLVAFLGLFCWFQNERRDKSERDRIERERARDNSETLELLHIYSTEPNEGLLKVIRRRIGSRSHVEAAEADLEAGTAGGSLLR